MGFTGPISKESLPASLNNLFTHCFLCISATPGTCFSEVSCPTDASCTPVTSEGGYCLCSSGFSLVNDTYCIEFSKWELFLFTFIKQTQLIKHNIYFHICHKFSVVASDKIGNQCFLEAYM